MEGKNEKSMEENNKVTSRHKANKLEEQKLPKRTVKQNIKMKNENNYNSINSYNVLSEYNEEDSETKDQFKELEEHNDEEDVFCNLGSKSESCKDLSENEQSGVTREQLQKKITRFKNVIRINEEIHD